MVTRWHRQLLPGLPRVLTVRASLSLSLAASRGRGNSASHSVNPHSHRVRQHTHTPRSRDAKVTAHTHTHQGHSAHTHTTTRSQRTRTPRSQRARTPRSQHTHTHAHTHTHQLTAHKNGSTYMGVAVFTLMHQLAHRVPPHKGTGLNTTRPALAHSASSHKTCWRTQSESGIRETRTKGWVYNIFQFHPQPPPPPREGGMERVAFMTPSDTTQTNYSYSVALT